MSYTHFTLYERECLQQLLEEGKNYSEIARILGRHRSSIQREVTRNYSKGKKRYHKWRATALYLHRRKKCVRHSAIQAGNEQYNYIKSCLELFWSPEVIAYKCKEKGFPVAHSTIYRAIKNGLFGKGAKKTYLRRRGKNSNLVHKNCYVIHPVHTIHDRPGIVDTRERFGDWEGDTVYGGIGKGCLVTLTERKSRLLAVARCPNREQNTIRQAFRRAFAQLGLKVPIESITLDNGTEFAAFEEIEKDLNTTIYFTDPHSPWQRGLNENTNDMIRFFFPKGTNFLKVSDEDVQLVVQLLNNRPRKCLGFLSPLDFFSAYCCT